ncbi:uncharacterized protein LOC120277708 [Dioscorea cayenensis subsp. rotundata]|uniref:Uncharacterized protein LOC120277708 n=1 Tax=Dioscorea cayennensis subsp. rotundata TaxID=55577 RepID=A0AB40CKT8_DIOCR|nr:uncharacterized protein LOC120277708 [Dioscorea cayenensis subsp. rotundata]
MEITGREGLMAWRVFILVSIYICVSIFYINILKFLPDLLIVYGACRSFNKLILFPYKNWDNRRYFAANNLKRKVLQKGYLCRFTRQAQTQSSIFHGDFLVHEHKPKVAIMELQKTSDALLRKVKVCQKDRNSRIRVSCSLWHPKTSV